MNINPTRRKPSLPTTVSETLVVAFNGACQFLAQPFEAQTLGLLLQTKEIHASGTSLTDIAIDEPNADPVEIGFDIQDPSGCPIRFRCNPAGLAFLILIVGFEMNLYVNYNRKGGEPYLKALRQSDEKARIVVARAFAFAGGAEDERPGEEVRYVDGDTRNLTHKNLRLSESRKVKTGMLSWIWALAHARKMHDALLPGSEDDKYRTANALLKQAWERLEAEREWALTDNPGVPS